MSLATVRPLQMPTFEKRRAIALQAYIAAVRKTGGIIHAEPSDAILDLLATSTLRRITRLIGLALPMAVASKRTSLSPVDINAAAALLDNAKVKEGFGIGFIRRES